MEPHPGISTAHSFNVQYRVGRVSKFIDGGHWLDYGCADGGYTANLLHAGASSVVGVDVAADRVEAAREANPGIAFHVAGNDRLAFSDGSFDGVFMNEVFEHVEDEGGTLDEVHRVLRPGGHLIVISPNRGFPFEGHGIQIGRWLSRRPTPFIPWLPRRLTDSWVSARNYWPQELQDKIGSHNFAVIDAGFVMPCFEGYPWVPAAMAARFRRHIRWIDHLPGVRRLGVSNLVVARRGPVPA